MNKGFGKKVFSKQQTNENKNQEKAEEKKPEDVTNIVNGRLNYDYYIIK